MARPIALALASFTLTGLMLLGHFTLAGQL